MSATITKRRGSKAKAKVNTGNIKYGVLYNGYAVSDARGLAPEGWHIPSKTEVDALVTYLGGSSVAAGALKEVGTDHWQLGNIGATNSSGFSAFGSGWRSINGVYFIHYWFYMLTTTFMYGDIYSLGLPHDSTVSFVTPTSQVVGASIRCVRDTDVGWVEGEQVTDIDGHVYDTVQIGTQIWLKQNLAVTHYRDGSVIPEVTDNTAWSNLTTGALCAYDNDWGNV